MVVVQAQQQGVGDLTSVEYCLGDVVDAEDFVGLLPVNPVTVLEALVVETRIRVRGEAPATECADELIVDVGVAGVLLERPDVVECVGQFVAQGVLVPIIEVETGLTVEAVARDLAVGVWQYRADCRQALGGG